MVIDAGTGPASGSASVSRCFAAASPMAPLLFLGDAVVVAVRNDSATVRVGRATDAIFFSDLAAFTVGVTACGRRDR